MIYQSQSPRKIFGSDLLKRQNDDSILKTVVTWGLAIGAAYYGGGFLLASMKKKRQENVLVQEQVKAATKPDSAAYLAKQLMLAISDYGNTDEQVVWDIFESKPPKIATREYFNDVAASYAIQTGGRDLQKDLYNNLDPWSEPWKPDWNRLKPTLERILANSRAKPVKPAPPKTKK